MIKKDQNTGNITQNFIELISEKDRNKLKTVLEEFDYNIVNEKEQTILHVACKEGDKDIVNMIADIHKAQNKQLDIISRRDSRMWTPIYYAIDASENGFPEIVDFLLKKGTDPNIQDDKGVTPLHLAAYKGQDDNVEILLKHKADPNIKDISGRIPLNYAIMEGQTNSVQALLESHSDLNSVDINGDSLAHYAILCKGNALLYVIMLAEKGININIQNKEGDTALNLCAKKGAKENIRIIQKLLELKADPNIVNNKQESFYSILSVEAEKDNFKYNSSDEESDTEENTHTGTRAQIESNTTKVNNGWSKFSIFLFVVIPTLILIISRVLGSADLKK